MRLEARGCFIPGEGLQAPSCDQGVGTGSVRWAKTRGGYCQRLICALLPLPGACHQIPTWCEEIPLSPWRDFLLSFCMPVLVETLTEQWGHVWAMGACCPQSSLLLFLRLL